MAAKKKTTTKKRKATPAQLAALAKGRAKRAKRVGTSQTKASMTTKKPPSKRLKKRRSKNTEGGYYPNPQKSGYQLTLVSRIGGAPIAWWNGHNWDDDARTAKFFTNLDTAKTDAMKAKKLTPAKYGIAAEPIKKR